MADGSRSVRRRKDVTTLLRAKILRTAGDNDALTAICLGVRLLIGAMIATCAINVSIPAFIPRTRYHGRACSPATRLSGRRHVVYDKTPPGGRGRGSKHAMRAAKEFRDCRCLIFSPHFPGLKVGQGAQAISVRATSI